MKTFISTLVFVTSFCLVFLMSISSIAFIQVQIPQKLETHKPTHILVVGRGSEQGYQFQQVAFSQIRKIQEIHPNDQILFITVQETSSNHDLLQNWGLQVTGSNKKSLTESTLLETLSPYQQIRSLRFIGHNAPHLGTALEGKTNRINAKSKNLEVLKNHFTEDGYIILEGCNTGYTLGPALSEKLQVPVAVSFTSTEFQRLHQNGQYYINDSGMYPEGGWASTNMVGFQEPLNCPSGACLRLKPHWIPYSGVWGNFADGGGLGFFKFFCSHLSEERCLKSMYESTLVSLSPIQLGKAPTIEKYQNQVLDLLCPNDRNQSQRQSCFQEILEGFQTNNRTYNPFLGNTFQCNFEKCDLEIKCSSFGLLFRSGCKVSNNHSGSTTTLMDEYAAYMKAFDFFGQKTN